MQYYSLCVHLYFVLLALGLVLIPFDYMGDRASQQTYPYRVLILGYYSSGCYSCSNTFATVFDRLAHLMNIAKLQGRLS